METKRITRDRLTELMDYNRELPFNPQGATTCHTFNFKTIKITLDKRS